MSRLTFALLLLASASVIAEKPAPPLKDFTDIKLADHGIKPVVAKKDAKTGFIVGGKNTTKLIKGLKEINGKSIADLEKVMRPGASSMAGFLGKDEKLLDVLAADNETVLGELKLTHQELAKHLHAMGAVADWQATHKQEGAVFLYHGRKFKVTAHRSFGFQPSPFDDGTKSGTDVTVTNLSNGKSLKYGLLVPFMVERYGFYEGKGTSYRLDPKKAIEVFDFLKKK
jgi:hypothetical protein